MAKSTIPLRPKQGSKYGDLTEIEMDCLTWHVISGRERLYCYVTFVRPELKKSPSAEKWCKQFFAMADTRNYLSDYKSTLEEFFTPKVDKVESSTLSDKERDRRKEAALQQFSDNVISTVGDSVDISVEALTDQANLLGKVGLLKGEEERVEAPRRYLPERCSSCAYKQFIDEQVKLGNIAEE